MEIANNLSVKLQIQSRQVFANPKYHFTHDSDPVQAVTPPKLDFYFK